MKNILTYWLSLIILRTLNIDKLNKFRKLEKNEIKLNKEQSHLDFNITCFNSDLLPIYTKIINNKIFIKNYVLLFIMSY